MELEDAAILGHPDRVIETDTIGDPNELDTERRAVREGAQMSRKKATRCGSSSSVAQISHSVGAR